SSFEPQVSQALQETREELFISVCSQAAQLHAVQRVGEVLQMVAGSVATGLHAQPLELDVAQDALLERAPQVASRLVAHCAHARRAAYRLRRFPRGEAACLRLPSSAAAKSPTRTHRRFSASRDARSLPSAIASR